MIIEDGKPCNHPGGFFALGWFRVFLCYAGMVRELGVSVAAAFEVQKRGRLSMQHTGL